MLTEQPPVLQLNLISAKLLPIRYAIVVGITAIRFSTDILNRQAQKRRRPNPRLHKLKI